MIKHFYSKSNIVRENIGLLSQDIISNVNSLTSNCEQSFAHHYWWNYRTKENIDTVLNTLKT